jgi:ketol-acid reductoisomerase
MIEKLENFIDCDNYDEKKLILECKLKINEIIDYINKGNNTKKFFLDKNENLLFFNEECEYIKKEDLEKFIIQNKQDVQFHNENEESEYMKQFYSGINYALSIIKARFCK